VKRLVSAPNLALATLWADLLRGAGLPVTVQRAFAGSIAGELPPDQAQPELWIADDDLVDRAKALLVALTHPPHRHWCCPSCREIVDGPFDVCWNCGAAMPA
jgi:Putative prokaryotic signal transducing protein